MIQALQMAELLFPTLQKTPADYEALYPPRALAEGARVTRFAPSPTGFLHIGGLFAALIAQRTAALTNGIFFVRIEDTDKKREIEDGISAICQGLDAFRIPVDEGISVAGEQGAYGPYQQSKRREIYQCYAKSLVQQGLAYPCFCTAEELDRIRAEQEAQKINPGYYGQWAVHRTITIEEAEAAIRQGRPYVLRLKSPGREEGRIAFEDVIKGKIEMPENVQDIVLLKSDGIPTYHFAHAVDDHLMRTTHVIRGDEWIASVPIHLQLFRELGFKPPKYAHIAPIMKEEDGGKRKLSKRKDPEAAISYYEEEGYPAESVLEYLMTLANSNFEEWRKANAQLSPLDFPFNLKRMSLSGALFDLQKLSDVSKNVIALFSPEQVYAQAAAWAKAYDPDTYALLSRDPGYAKRLFRIDRGGNKPRKDIAKWRDVAGYTAYFFPETFQREDPLPEHVPASEAAVILRAYQAVYTPEDDRDTWFGRVKELCAVLSYSPNIKAYQKDPGAFKGHVGDVTTVIRLAMTGRSNSPDLYEIMQVLGPDCVRARFDQAIQQYGEEQ